MTHPATASERMASSRRIVDGLLAAARLRARSGDDAAALVLLSAAATLSRRRHAGCFTNPELEAQIRDLGERLLLAPVMPQARSHAGKERVVHVMTRGYAAGGHTRLVEQWLRGEHDAVSDVVMTEVGDAPAGLAAAVAGSGGRLYGLTGDGLERARQLQAIAADADRVVLSAHENDVVALVALAGVQERPPLVVLNHAEHAYWAGAALADVVVSLRPASAELAARRRGVGPERSVVVPLPVATRRRREAPDVARRALGIEPGDRVLLTIGWRYKFTPYAGSDIIKVLAPIVEQRDVHLLAVGPRAGDDLWLAAHARYGGRVHATGRQDDLQRYLDAADVVIDSYPVASLTALLDAASMGIPVVGLAPRGRAWPAILHEDDPALAAEVFDDVEAYRDRIRTLLRDRAAWHSASRSVQGRAQRTHGSDAQLRAMQRVREAIACGSAGERQPSRLRELGTPGAEDDILATYIADCEDRLIRTELRLQPYALGGTRLDPRVAIGVAHLDELLLGPVSPSVEQYDEAQRRVQALRG